MKTQRTIGMIVGAIVLGVVAFAVGIVSVLGTLQGLAVVVAGAAFLVGLYAVVIGPRLRRWGASDAEVAAALPGDERRPGAPATTRAIGIAAPAEAVWPWLVQLGWGRGGWYSYDWIDNDGQPSATRIDPALQDLDIGDQILMTPTMGPTVRELVPGHHLVADDPALGTWCLALRPTDDGCRLVSRWRVDPPAPSPAAWAWTALVDPGSWFMEQRMLRTLKARAEGAREPRPAAAG